MSECSDFEVKWNVFAQPVNVIGDMGLHRPRKMIEIIQIQEYSFYFAG
jgi:hypothetical protein